MDAATVRALQSFLFPCRSGDIPLSELSQELRRYADLVDSQERRHLSPSVIEKKSRRIRTATRELDFNAYEKRYVALEILYLGWDYHGFASQKNTPFTVEGRLFAALVKCRLVPEGSTWSQLNYSRCGRTDKGVSALGQVVALNLRSGAARGASLLAPEHELDYPAILNRALPSDIRVLGWTPIPQDFSARFSAQSREYKYFFVQDGSLDVAAMNEAAQKLVGLHDFRNLCKVDVRTMKHFMRRINSASVELSEGVTCGAWQMVVLHLNGTAFLWHQVRCIAAVLHMVGKGWELPSVMGPTPGCSEQSLEATVQHGIRGPAGAL
eukprot:jgi/Botrbrau1/21423/Bobra.0216s0038.1